MLQTETKRNLILLSVFCLKKGLPVVSIFFLCLLQTFKIMINYISLKKKKGDGNTLQVFYNRVCPFFGTDVPDVGFNKWSSFKIYKNLLLGLLKSKYKKNLIVPIARIPVIFFERQSLRSSFSSRMSFSSLIFFSLRNKGSRPPSPT